jgi:hypothetical protein
VFVPFIHNHHVSPWMIGAAVWVTIGFLSMGVMLSIVAGAMFFASVLALDTNPVPPWIINGAIIGLTAGLSFVSALYFALRKERINKAAHLAEANVAMVQRVSELEAKLALVNAAVIPISTAFQAILIRELTHLHTPEMDALLVKIGPPLTLTPAEEERLAVMLRERAKDKDKEIPNSERDAALILPAVMKRARAEQALLQTAQDLKLQVISVAGLMAVSGVQSDQPVAILHNTEGEQGGS